MPTNIEAKRRLAARVFGVGVERIWIDPERLDEVASAVSRADIRHLEKIGVIKVLPKRGIAKKERKERKRGPGSRKGSKYARIPRKRYWIMRIRVLRKELRRMRDSGEISGSLYRRLYMLAKGGFFRSKAALREYVKRITEGRER